MRPADSTPGDPNGSSQQTLAGPAGGPGSMEGPQPLNASSSSEEGSRMIENTSSYRTQFPDPDWHQIAERAADEKDPKKLAYLIKALCDRLEELKHSRFSDRK